MTNILKRLESLRLNSQSISDSIADKPFTEPRPSPDTGVSVRDLLSRTLDYGIFDLANSSKIRALIGTSLQPAVPAILASGARPLSWMSNLSPTATYGSVAYPDVMGAYGQFETLGDGFDVVQPMLADAMSYMRAVSDTQKSVYSQTPRAEGMHALSFPLTRDIILMTEGMGALGYEYAANNYVSRGDTFTFDFIALLQSWIAYNSVFNGTAGTSNLTTIAYSNYISPLNGWFPTGAVSPKKKVNSWTTPVGNMVGFKQDLSMIIPAKSGVPGIQITAVAEAIRQLLTSPVVLLTGTTRPFGLRGRDAAINTVQNDYLGIQGASGSAGIGSIAISIFMGVNIGGTAFQYPKLDFRLAFDKLDNSNKVSFLVPRGASVSGVIQPGFSLSSSMLSPLRLNNFTSLVLSIEANATGAAAGMQWGLSLANPSSLLLKQLLL